MDTVFRGLHWYVDMRRRAGIVVRGVVVRVPDMLSSIIGAMNVAPSGAARPIIIGSHVALSRGCSPSHAPDTRRAGDIRIQSLAISTMTVSCR